jgi:peptide/nickel transport system ATP-binding protein
MSVLEVRELFVAYQRRDGTNFNAVAGASLSVGAGEIVGLVGETGCGKSSLAKAACGLIPIAAGEVLFEGQRMEPLRRRSRNSAEVGLQMVFQNPYGSLNPRRRIGDQISDGLRTSRSADIGSADRERIVGEMLERVGLPSGAARRLPGHLSGGQRQRAAIARALAPSPSVLVLDEPLSALDASVQAQVAMLLAELSRDLGIGMLLISHDLAIVHQIAHRMAVMYLGQVIETGETRALWHKPLHPYTKALIGAIPSAERVGQLPAAPAGSIPDPAHPPAGCRFHPRCPVAMEVCGMDPPAAFDIGSGRSVACWLSRQDGAIRTSDDSSE